MTSKEIFEAIDLEKVGPELKTKLLALEKATEGFTNERADARMETSMNAVYNFIKDKKPEALKNVEVKTVTVEETITKTQGGKKVRTKQTIRKKVAGKRKKNTKKTPTPSAKNPIPNVPQIAREIRKEGESWSDALSRAKVIYNKKKDDQKVKAKKALDDLRDFMKSDKFLKGWPRTYGKENAADNDLERDLARPAKAPGRRISKTGRVYYENRDNRSDREANTFPRKIYLKGGGKLPDGTKYYGVNEIEFVELQDGTKLSSGYGIDNNMLSGIYVSPKSTSKKDEFQTELEFAKGGLTKSDYFYIPRDEVKRVVLSEALHDSKEIDGDKVLNGIWMEKSSRTKQLEKEFSAREAKRRLKKMELGGEVYVQPTIIQNNPDYLVGTTTMYEMFELGGEIVVQPTILQNNPDYITSTATMSDYFEKGGIMAKGGYVAVSEKDGYWYIISKPTSKEEAQQVIDMGVPRGEMGKVVSLDEAKAYKKVIGREYLEKGGAIGFDALAKKVAKRYAGKKVKSEYQDEYGKTYSDEEAMEVGRKVAAKVYRQQQAKMAKGGLNSPSLKPYNYVYYDSTDYNYPYTLIIGNLAWGISEEFGPTFLGNIQKEFFNSTQEFAAKSGYLVNESELPVNVAESVKQIRAKNFETLRGQRYEIKAEEYPATFAKGGNVESMDKAWEVKVMRDDEVLETFMVRGRNRGEAREVVEDYHEDKMEGKHGDDIYFAIEEAPEKFAKGGAMEHMIFAGDEVLAIHKNMLIVESDLGQINVLDLSTEPIARRISIEPITGKNTLASAMEFIDADPSFKTSKMAMGGSLETHGLEEGDLIVEDEGAYITILSEDGKTFYVDLGRGDRETEPPLPFEHGGEVKVGDIARLAAKYNKTGQEVVAAISEGADVEVEHTEDRKKAMRIAVDHLDEDFYYYPKLKAAEGQPDFSDFYEKGGQVPEQFLDSKGERKIDAKSIEELTDYVMALPQTKSIYFNQEAQEYVPSRRKLHADIINKFKEEVVCITEGQPIAIFMGGSPASGKSSFLRKYSPYLLKEEILKVDADEIRAMLPEYDGYNAAQTHLETKDIVNTLLSDKNIGIPCDFDLIYDGTMNSVKSYIPLMDILRKRGYKIFIVYMDKVPKDVIIKRALERYKKSGRFVPLEVIEDFFEKGKTAFNDLKKDVDGYMVIDGSNQDYEIIEQGGIKLPTNREYSKLGSKIDPKDIPALYKKGGKTKKA